MSYFVFTSDAGALRRAWLPLLLWGLAQVALGVLVIGWPIVLGRALLILLGAFSVLSGIVWVWWAVSLWRASEGLWMITSIPGVVLVAFGVFALLNPDRIAQFFLWVVGAVVVLWGVVDMASSVRLRRFFRGWWLRLVRGLLLATLGALVLLRPAAGLQTLAWLVGALPLLAGVLTVWMAVWARALPERGAVLVTDSGEAPMAPRGALDEGRPTDEGIDTGDRGNGNRTQE